MALSRGRVSFKNTDGMEHAAEVHAETLYEAVALAVKEFLYDEISESCPAPDDRVHRRRIPQAHRTHDPAEPRPEMGAEHHQGRTGGHHKA